MGLMPIVSVHAAIGVTQIDYFDDPDWLLDYVLPLLKGDTIRVVGTGVTAGATVNVYWDNALKETFTDGTGKVASGTAKANGGYSIKFVVPEGLVGPHYIWVKDVASGNTASFEVEVAPKLSVSPSSGLKGDKITVTGYGYGYNDDDEVGWKVDIYMTDPYITPLVTFTPTEPKTNTLGTFTATFTVPTGLGYADYYIYAQDEDTNEDTDGVKFTVGASITLSISEGPVGSVVTITGRGFYYPDDVTVDIGGSPCYIASGVAVRSDGRISTKIVIPDKDMVDDEPTKYTITVEDTHSNVPTAKFTVNGIAEIKATPSYGVQGTQITVEGWNFTKISGTEVTLAIGASTKKIKTDSKGYFKGTIQIPATGSGDQTLSADIADHHIYADAQIRVGIMMVILTPNSGPSGTKVSITGVGFDEVYTALTVNLGDDEWFTTDSSGGLLSESKNVPSLEPGTYTVTVIEEESEIAVTATFTVTEKTTVTLSPTMAPNTYEVTVEGWFFAESPDNPSVEFLLYNATHEWVLPATYSNADADPPIPVSTVELELDEDWDDGYFKGKFPVPDEDSISIGSYILNVTDGEGMFAQIAFQVVPKTTTITPRKATFRIGETVAYNVQSSFKQENAYIKIYDPSGNQYWRTDAFEPGKWTKIGEVQVYPFYQQTAGGNAMMLLEDAPLGTYTWKWYDEDAELLDSGSFTVAAAAEAVLGQQLEDLNTAVTDLTTDITTVSTEVAAVRTQITNAINAANAAVQAANAATQAVNAVAQTANAASTAATNAANAATEAKNAANGLTTLVYGAIGASLVAALAAIVSLMQISRRIAG